MKKNTNTYTNTNTNINTDIKKIIILSTKYTLISANNLRDYFIELNINTEIITNDIITNEIVDKIKDNNTYLFLLGISHITNIESISLPIRKYIIYQIDPIK